MHIFLLCFKLFRGFSKCFIDYFLFELVNVKDNSALISKSLELFNETSQSFFWLILCFLAFWDAQSVHRLVKRLSRLIDNVLLRANRGSPSLERIL